MATSDAFAFKNSGLNAFLFAEVGQELNGSPLTILSVLARLGKDPWAEAAKWVGMPKSATIDRLTQSISQMPLCPEALTDARATASRLILLLPSQTSAPRENERPAAAGKASVPRWVLVAICLAAIGLGFAFTLAPTSSSNQVIAPLNEQHPQAPSR
ncbi:MAG: hypothetical protein QOF90_3360 [Acetobacteraceae bacterium]|jgi:hypothetical protein|nr:hypothetical protein [Acetobacteraceae bacterium]